MGQTLQSGDSIQHYRILSRLGAGGMGEVYKAEDTNLQRPLAIKILFPESTNDQERVQRFIQEAKAASALNHPHIVHIYEAGHVEHPLNLYFIAMELIDGDTLRKSIREKADLRKLLEPLAQIADALAKAHAAGIVHRDLKPENIMLSHDGYAKVVDFGLAKLLETASADAVTEDTPTRSHLRTEAGMVVGTAGYMSPEQVQGKSVDHRSDIFSFGCILYEAATGRRPFLADSVVDTLHNILHSNPAPLSSLNPNVPAELQRIVRKCMAKDPEERYQSMKEIAIDLRELKKDYDLLPLASGSQSGYRKAPTQSSLRWLVPVLLLALTLALVFVFSRSKSPLKQEVASPSFQNMKIQRITSSGNVRYSSISPDGKYVIYIVSDSGQSSLRLKQIATGSDLEIAKAPPSVAFAYPVFSPDGNFVYYHSQSRDSGTGLLYRVPVLGGDSKKLITDIDTPVTFSPDGARIAFVRGMPGLGQTILYTAASDGSSEKEVAVSSTPQLFQMVTTPAWSPDGKKIVCVQARSDSYMQIVEVLIENGKIAPITSYKWRAVDGLAWLADGSGLIVDALDQGIYRQISRISYPEGNVYKITNDLNDYSGVNLTANSDSLVTVQVDSRSNIWVADSKKRDAITAVTSGNADYGRSGLCFTADGRILFSSNRDGNSNLHIMNRDGTNLRQITNDLPVEAEPAVSPDGKFIVFSSNRDRNFNIWRTDMDGNNATKLTSGVSDNQPSYSPDGKWIVFLDESSVKPVVYRIPAEGGQPVKITDWWSGFPSVGPDNTTLASWNAEIVPQDSPNLGTRVSLSSVESGVANQLFKITGVAVGELRWIENGRSLAYATEENGISTVWSQSIKGGPPKQIMHFSDNPILSFDWSRDGNYFACARGASTRDAVLISQFR